MYKYTNYKNQGISPKYLKFHQVHLGLLPKHDIRQDDILVVIS